MAEPVLLINALGQGDEPWTPLCARLARRHHPTLWSPDLTVPWHDQVDVLVDLLRTHERPVHLVGWCTGPKTALRAAAQHRDLVASLILLNPSFKVPGRPATVDTPYETELAELLHAVDDRPRMAARLVTVLRAQRAAAGASPAGMPDQLRESCALPFVDAPSLIAYATAHLGFWADDPLTEPAVRRLTLPITAISGGTDPVVAAADVRSVVAALGHTRVEIVDAGHFALYTHADAVVELIEAHLAAVPLAHSQGS
jgi:pimeloyl-ACP methyl ester carboxylesterase